jgi:hypothetical protein|tara:strand:- start:837 stop:1148 length:312 start_codon:yes stop_codon:yes gene_type:complete
MKKLFTLILVLFAIGCQREKANEVGVGYNKSLIIPPSNDLPEPNSQTQGEETTNSLSDNSIVKSILDQTDATQVNESVIERIDNESGYKTDKNFFQWLFKDKI